MRAEQQIIALATEKTAFGNPRKPLSRVDRASTGPVDLVTDRQKYAPPRSCSPPRDWSRIAPCSLCTVLVVQLLFSCLLPALSVAAPQCTEKNPGPRPRYEGLGMLALIIMPVLLVNVVIVTNLAGGFNHWDDLEPHIMSVLSQPPSIVLGVRNATGAFGFLVNNKYYLPLVNTRVTVEVRTPLLLPPTLTERPNHRIFGAISTL